MSVNAPHTAPASSEQVLAALVAELRAMAEHRGAEGGPVAAIRALILGLLARLLARFEAMFLDWKRGLLPPPSRRALRPHVATPPETATPPAAPRLAAPHPRAPRSPMPAPMPSSSLHAAAGRSQKPTVRAHRGAGRGPACVHPVAIIAPGRRPRREIFSKPLPAAAPTRVQIITNSECYIKLATSHPAPPPAPCYNPAKPGRDPR